MHALLSGPGQQQHCFLALQAEKKKMSIEGLVKALDDLRVNATSAAVAGDALVNAYGVTQHNLEQAQGTVDPSR